MRINLNVIINVLQQIGGLLGFIQQVEEQNKQHKNVNTIVDSSAEKTEEIK